MIQYGIYLLLVILTIISIIVVNMLSKERDFFHKAFFFYSCYYFVMSLVKWRLEGPELTLFQSFWEAGPRTFINYGAPLLIVAVVAPVMLWLVLRQSVSFLVRWHVSLIIVSMTLCALLFGKVTNKCYVISFPIVFCIAFILGVVIKRKQSFASISEVKNELIKKYLIIDILPVFLVLFYFPNELYLTNINEFSNPYWSFVIILLVATLLISMALFGLTCFLPVNWIDICQYIIFSGSICAYLQYLFLNGSMQALSGSEQGWSIYTIVSNFAIWLILISGIVFFAKKCEKVVSIMKYISAFIMLILLATTVTLIAQNISLLNKSSEALTNDGDLVLANENNVVVFVLDMYDTRLFEDIINNNQNFSEPLKDFTFYDNTVSRYIMTYFAVPYMLTGAEWQDNTDGRWYNRYAYDGDTFLAYLDSNNIDIGVYTAAEFVGDNHYSMIRNYRDDVEKKSDISSTIATMCKTSLYKIMPFAIKNNYSYYSSDIFYMVDAGDVWNTDNDRVFYERIIDKGISIDDDISSAFRFYHMRGAHDPYYLSEDVQIDRTKTQATAASQGKGTMNVVYAYIEELKKQGLYDNTTIIITADHGNPSGYDEKTDQMNEVSMPLMLVKRASQEYGSMNYNHAPVEQGDMLATILDAYGLDYSNYGYRLEDVTDEQQRIRLFGFARPGQGLLKGYVTGEAHNLDNWIVESVIDVEVTY